MFPFILIAAYTLAIRIIYTIIKTISEFRNVSVTVTAVGVVEVGVVETRYGVSQPGADAER